MKPGAVPRIQPVGDDVARFARADQPRDGVQSRPAGRARHAPGIVGRFLAAMRSSRTQAMTPSSYDGYGRQPNRGRPSSRRPCHGQMRARSRPCRWRGRRPGVGRRRARRAACRGVRARRPTRSPRRRCRAVLCGCCRSRRTRTSCRSVGAATSHGGIDDRGRGLTVGGPLSRPSCSRGTGWNGAVLVNRALRSASMVMSEAAFPVGEQAQGRRAAVDRNRLLRGDPQRRIAARAGWPPTNPWSPRAPSAPRAGRPECRRPPALGRHRVCRLWVCGRSHPARISDNRCGATPVHR